MADFGNFSDTDEESAVEDVITQAKELSVLEQVSAINCSGFTDDSVLPTELESRFRKLKSFPATVKPKTHINDNHHHIEKRTQSLHHHSNPISKAELLSDSKQNPGGKPGLGTAKSISSCDSSPSSAIFSESKQNSGGEIYFKENSRHGSFSASASVPVVAVSSKLKLKSKSKSFSSPLSSPSSWMDLPSSPPSPPQRKGCFWCSPKSASKKKSRESPIFGDDLDWGNKNDEFLLDLNTFSVKEQEKILKKAMKEQERVSREAEKIVKWAKQESMRISDHYGGALDDELSDD
ncbi:hypothetical protein AB3S75_015267 [Citrus x aurantiifolia]